MINVACIHFNGGGSTYDPRTAYGMCKCFKSFGGEGLAKSSFGESVNSVLSEWKGVLDEWSESEVGDTLEGLVVHPGNLMHEGHIMDNIRSGNALHNGDVNCNAENHLYVANINAAREVQHGIIMQEVVNETYAANNDEALEVQHEIIMEAVEAREYRVQHN
ncbi:hypothetical protein VNO78_10307 [Psophocarpus tetragonolobus]|uniref:Uncharacterized protein n=1 Tax=Psophocarpus tetragonolobus TaxID=3891 RepID=A0AAN9XMF1_PSOTE